MLSFDKPTMLLAVRGPSVILNSSPLTLCPFLNIYKSYKLPEALINDHEWRLTHKTHKKTLHEFIV